MISVFTMLISTEISLFDARLQEVATRNDYNELQHPLLVEFLDLDDLVSLDDILLAICPLQTTMFPVIFACVLVHSFCKACNFPCFTSFFNLCDSETMYCTIRLHTPSPNKFSYQSPLPIFVTSECRLTLMKTAFNIYIY